MVGRIYEVQSIPHYDWVDHLSIGVKVLGRKLGVPHGIGGHSVEYRFENR